jgi:hypothetical protein
MVKPKPVPPNFLVVELSSCVKALNIFLFFSKIPIPVSVTAKRIYSMYRQFFQTTSKCIDPFQ